MNNILSTTHDTDGHTIERLMNDELRITRNDGHRITDAEHNRVTAWYWSHVGIKGNDPDPNAATR